MDCREHYHPPPYTPKARDALLLVEDNPDLADLVRVAVAKSRIDAELIVAHDGLEALDLIFGNGIFSKRREAPLPRLVLLDLNLPKFKGNQLLQVLKSEARTQYLPIVVLSGSDYEIDALDSLNLGATAFVRKPKKNYLSEMIGIIERYWPGPAYDAERAPPD